VNYIISYELATSLHTNAINDKRDNGVNVQAV